MSNTTWWTRLADRVLELVLVLAALGVGLFRVLLPILGVNGPLSPGYSREVRVDDAVRLPVTAVSEAVTLRGSGHAELAFADPSLGQRLLLALPGLVGGLLLVVVLAALLRMARTFRDGDFFAPQNTRRLTVIAAALMLMGFLVPLLDMMTTNLLAHGLPATTAITPAKNYAVQPMFLAVLVGAAAAAFRAGTRMRADTEGLV
ncbi:DUF2975 domain-containing protein [Streptomyces kaniharaensis]|uniref:DUF2975 domain-containing protein n=1 Tax=Streptomyces kaniharaensis TaxID=212423 RepID=A0A6N7KYC0_9ACTN|nr:DUF2975 domain-containing protein [Streptomyces kaniharaensis]MQS16501.1 DUF2975 domain-containing protein [Streptomyces kaniharaensis]